jgi:hypothetical protein
MRILWAVIAAGFAGGCAYPMVASEDGGSIRHAAGMDRAVIQEVADEHCALYGLRAELGRTIGDLVSTPYQTPFDCVPPATVSKQ